jgi:uncharacterized membrane protein (UPF0127 family)
MKSKSNILHILVTGLIGLIGLIFLIWYLNSKHSLPNIQEFLKQNPVGSSQTIIQAPQGIIKAEIATSSEALEQGLSGRVSLPQNQGMLFVFSQVGNRGFWMRNMSFPIDIVWINKDKVVVGVSANVDPSSYPNLFFPPSPIKYVLELNAGYANKNGITASTTLTFVI